MNGNVTSIEFASFPTELLILARIAKLSESEGVTPFGPGGVQIGIE
jgi:hypothetical protein